MDTPVFNCKNADDVLKAVRDQNVSFLQFWFMDIVGNLKSFQITPKELEAAFEEGIGFDGSSILGFTRIEESDMVAMPDPASFQLASWRPQDRPVARVFADIKNPDGTPFAGDSRHVLKRQLERAAAKGYSMYVGPELEFFLFSSSTETRGLDVGGYFDAPPLDLGNDIRREIIFNLERMGIPVEYSHHESAPSQHEIDLRFQDALRMADIAVTYKVIVKDTARRHGCYATFMPKPIMGQNGSGMHVHQSLFKNGRNSFFDSSEPGHLSRDCRAYIAGLLRYAGEFAAITNPLVNSYKRLVPGYEAPVYVAWANRNRSALIRVPAYKPGKESGTRIELRCPDPTCNPYLAFAAMLGAGLKGIEDGMALASPVEENIYAMSDAEMAERGITAMPGSLNEAIASLEGSSLMRDILGEHLHREYCLAKKKEWNEFRVHVSQFELDRYLPTT